MLPDSDEVNLSPAELHILTELDRFVQKLCLTQVKWCLVLYLSNFSNSDFYLSVNESYLPFVAVSLVFFG